MIKREDFLSSLSHINHSKVQRDYFAQLLIEHPEFVKETLDIAADLQTKASYKALWALEFMCRKKPEGLLPHLNSFIILLPLISHDSGLRPAAKICEYLINSYYSNTICSIKNVLTKDYREQIATCCFDWLITDQKVATKAYSMTCLQLLGTEFDWIHSELRLSIEKQYATHSAAFQARARMVLSEIAKIKN